MSFKPGSDDIFAISAFDSIVRVMSVSNKKVIEWKEIHDNTTSLSYSLDGERLLAGTLKGSVAVFDTTTPSMIQLDTIHCKNRRGKFSKGRKVTEIKFILNRRAVITTSDSRVREIDLNSGKQVFKFKGHKNKDFSLRADISDDQEVILAPSEDGFVYAWR